MNAPVINNVWIKFVNVFHRSFWMAANVNIHVTGNNAVKMLNVILKIRKLFANVNLAVAVMLCLAVLTLMNAHHFCRWIQTVLVVLDQCVSTLWALSDVNARLALQVILIKKMAALVAYQDVLPIRNARIKLECKISRKNSSSSLRMPSRLCWRCYTTVQHSRNQSL